MIEARETVEHEIWWEIIAGSANVWHENWTKLGALYHVVPDEYPINQEMEEVAELVDDGNWKEDILQQNFPLEIVDHIKSEIHIDHLYGYWDKPWWMATTSGNFTVNSAWELLKHREAEQEEYKHMWIKGIPFKISFFLWRLWKFKLPTDDQLKRMKISIISRCYCCPSPQEETIHHLFVTGNFAKEVWTMFMKAAGLHISLIQTHQVIRSWWNTECGDKLKPILQAVPAMVTWELWKRRNNVKHGGSVSFNRVVHEVNNNLYYLAKLRYPWLKNIPFLWPEMVRFLEGYKSSIATRIVYWRMPADRCYKCNTDGALKGNPGLSSYGFCVRDWRGDLVYAQCKDIGETTNVVAEASAMMEGLSLCVSKNYLTVTIETDSMLLKNLVEGIWKAPWCIATLVNRIKDLKDRHEVEIQHVLREGNYLADFMTNLAFDFAGTSRFNNFSELPSAGRKIINMEKQQIPNLRIRTTRNNNFQVDT